MRLTLLHRITGAGTLSLLLALAACGRGGSGALTDDRALEAADADPANWITNGRTYSEQRHSPLTDINEENINRLGLAWSLDLDTSRGLEATPLVKDGVLYTTSAWSVLYAVDAQTGRQLWMHDPQVPKDHSKFACCDVVNRGAALYQGKVYSGTIDGRLIAVDAETGSLVWETQTTPEGSAYSITGAPRVVKGRILIGNGGAEYGVRGYVSAYDAETGELAWRTYTVPGDPSKPFESEAMRRAAETWTGEWWIAGGGGTAWDSIVYDPDLDLVYVGTGNGSPWYERLRSPDGGDNLYLASILALRADTGEQVWHFQTTPGDNWDYTAVQPLLLADLTINEQQRRVIMQAPKNGFFYVLDRETGECISAKEFTTITWATGIDSQCRPIESSEARALQGPTLVKPSPHGAHNWYPMSFNPTTGLVYFSVVDDTRLHVVNDEWTYDPGYRNVGNAIYFGPMRDQQQAIAPTGRLVAWDPVAQQEAWRAEHPVPLSGGTLSTAANLIFQGRADGMFRAYRATDGELLWEFQADPGILAAPMTYTVDGTQYIAVLAGLGGPSVLGNRPLGEGRVGPGRLLAFSVDGSAELTIPDRTPPPVPMPTFAVQTSADELAQGRALYSQFCSRCHGANAASAGSVPDLRHASTAIHETFEDVVRGGVRRQFGMPSFAEDVTSEDVRMIQAYVLDRARESARAASSAP